MKSLILFITIFLYTLSLNTIVLGQEQGDDAHCPFVLFHIIKEGKGLFSQETVRQIHFLLRYGVDVNPNLEDECFDPYYKSLPKGSTLLHVLMSSSMHPMQLMFLYYDFVDNGADRAAVDENGKTAYDIFCWPQINTSSDRIGTCYYGNKPPLYDSRRWRGSR